MCMLKFLMKAPFIILADVATLGNAGHGSFTRRAFRRETDRQECKDIVRSLYEDGDISKAEMIAAINEINRSM